MEHSIMKNVGTRGITDMRAIPLPPKGIMTIQRARADGVNMGSLYTRREEFYFENGKFYQFKAIGNMNYNKQFPVRKPVLGKWDEHSIREVK